MQSSSSGMLPMLGLLACAAGAGAFAAHQWPKGPPNSLLGAWDFLSCEVLHRHHREASPPKPDYGPAPKFDGPPTGLSAPPVVEFDPPATAAPLAEVSDRREPKAPTAGASADTASQDAAPLSRQGAVRPISDRTPTDDAQQPARAAPDDRAKTSVFWPNNWEDLLPGVKSAPKATPGPSAKGPAASPPAAALSTPPAAAPVEPRVEDSIRRLEQLGAVVVRLERQRGPGGNYLFRCELPMPQNPRYHRYFQAVDSQPARAALRVTHEVESWLATLKK